MEQITRQRMLSLQHHNIIVSLPRTLKTIYTQLYSNITSVEYFVRDQSFDFVVNLDISIYITLKTDNRDP